MSKRNQGIMLAIIGTMFWGISGPFAQALFAQNVKPLWLVGARLLLAGILLSVWGGIVTDKEQHKEMKEGRPQLEKLMIQLGKDKKWGEEYKITPFYLEEEKGIYTISMF